MTEAAPLESSPHRIMIRHDGPPWKRSKTTVVGYNISLPNGSSCRVLGEWVLELKIQAQEQLQKPFLQLCSPEGCILDPNKKCDSYDDLQENATITAIAQQPKVAATNCAFSLWCTGGSRVLSWGHHKSGGDAAGVMQSLINVVDMKATEHAFVAILGSGKVVTWGDAESGGDSSMVQDRLQHVQKVFATDRAFAAVLKDGGVVTWGCALHGGDSLLFNVCSQGCRILFVLKARSQPSQLMRRSSLGAIQNVVVTQAHFSFITLSMSNPQKQLLRLCLETGLLLHGAFQFMAATRSLLHTSRQFCQRNVLLQSRCPLAM